jgi:hypothetical protein
MPIPRIQDPVSPCGGHQGVHGPQQPVRLLVAGTSDAPNHRTAVPRLGYTSRLISIAFAAAPGKIGPTSMSSVERITFPLCHTDIGMVKRDETKKLEIKCRDLLGPYRPHVGSVTGSVAADESHANNEDAKRQWPVHAYHLHTLWGLLLPPVQFEDMMAAPSYTLREVRFNQGVTPLASLVRDSGVQRQWLW